MNKRNNTSLVPDWVLDIKHFYQELSHTKLNIKSVPLLQAKPGFLLEHKPG